jgi:hypothetical protein
VPIDMHGVAIRQKNTQIYMEENVKNNKSIYLDVLTEDDGLPYVLDVESSRPVPVGDRINNTQRFKMPLDRAQKDQLRKQQKTADRPAAMVVQAGEKIPISVCPHRPAAAATPKS